MSDPTRPDIPALLRAEAAAAVDDDLEDGACYGGHLVMPQDEFEMVKWAFEMIGGPAFPGNAAAACRIAAARNFAGSGEVFRRLAVALDSARPADPAPLSATCTGPDCGTQFTDSETGEYEACAAALAAEAEVPEETPQGESS